MATVETLEIEIKKNASDASDGIESLIATLTQLKQAASGGAGLTAAVNQIRRLGAEINNISGSGSGLTSTLGTLRSIADIDFSNIREAAQGIQAMTGMNLPGGGGCAPGQLPPIETPDAGNADEVTEATRAVGEAARRTGEDEQEAERHTISFGEALRRLKTGLEGIVSGLASAGKAAAKGFGKLFATSAKKALSPIISLGKAFNNFKKSIGRIALYRLVRSAIKGIGDAAKEGKDNLARYSAALNSTDAASANATMSEYASTLLQVKNSVGAAVMPALTALLPIVNAIASAFITAANAVNQFLQAFSGKGTFTKAKKNTVDYAKSLDKATGSAKELNKTLLGFDEINRLNEQNSGGGGGSGVDYSNMFEEATVASGITDFVNQIKEAFQNGDWDAIGEIIGGKVNELSAKLLELFTLPGLNEKVAYVGSSIASALNSLVSSIDWVQLGQAIGSGLNLALTFLVTFLYSFDWIQLGVGVADLLNGAIASIDWTNVGKFLWSGFKIAIEFLAGLIIGIDAKELADAISEMTIGFVDSISETIKSIDWQKMGNQIADLIKNIDWAGIAESLAYLIGAALGALVMLVYGAIESAVNGIINYFSEKIEECGGNVGKGLLKGIGDGLKNLGKWLKEHIVDPLVNGVKDLLGIHSTSKVFSDIGGLVIDGFLGGLKDTWETVKNWWDNTVGAWIKNAKDKIVGFFSGGQSSADSAAQKASTGGQSAKGYATGGFVTSGQLFYAREAGPELVGSIGGRTAVANNDQIVDAVSDGVYRAIAPLMSGMQGGATHIYLDGKEITAGQNRRNRMYGAALSGV